MLRIGQIAKALGTTTKTLRFYEQIGLLGSAERSASRYRLYDEAALRRARLVVGLRRLGFSVDEVHNLLQSPDQAPSLRQRLMAMMDDKLRDLELNLSILQGRRDDLDARHAALLATPRDRPGQCICAALPNASSCDCGRAAGSIRSRK